MLQANRDAPPLDECFRSIINRLSEAVVCCDSTGHITLINSTAAKLFERDSQHIGGESLKEFLPQVLWHIQEYAGGGEFLVDLLQKDGKSVQLSASVESHAWGAAPGYAMILRPWRSRISDSRDAARLAAIVESSDDGIIGKTLGGVITSWNSGAQRIFGYTADEMIGEHISRLIPADRPDEEAKIIERLRRGIRVDHFDTIRLAKDGTPIDVSLSISPIRDASGQIVGAAKIVRDISERKRAAATRQSIEQRMRMAVDAAQMGIWDWDIQTQEVTWSNRFANIFGIGTLCGTFDILESCLHPSDRAMMRDRILKAFETRSDYHDEYRVVWADGTVHWIEARGRAIDDQQNNSHRMTGTVLDITEKKAATDAVMLAEQRLQVAIEAVNVGFWDWDLKTGKLTGSSRLAEMMGTTDVEALFDPHTSNIHPDDLAATSEKLKISIATGAEYLHEFRVIWPDKNVHWLEGRGRAINDESEQPVRMLVFVVDITQRKEHEEEKRLRESELAHLSRLSTMGNIASGLAHELNQPLGAILNYAGVCVNLAKSPPVPVPQFIGALNEVMSETRRAAAIIGRLRSFVKKQSPKTAPVDVNELIRKSVALLDFEIRHERVNIQLNLADALPPSHADTVQIEQVLVNLIFNAMQAMSDLPVSEKHISIQTARLSDSAVEVSVIDTGPGMSPESFEHLFEPFFTTKSQGMGMGLNISRSIMENHGGKLSAAINPDRGMRFSFTLPTETMEGLWKPK